MRKAGWFGTIGFLLVFLFVATGCSGEQAATEKESGEEPVTAGAKADKTTLVAGLDDDPPQLDPHFSTAAVDRQVYHSIYDKLVDVDDQLNFVPQLAEKWDISEDGKTYTLHLQKGVTFHDGTPFNAEAVKFNFDRMMDPDAGSSRTSELSPVESVTAVDEHTVEIKLKEAFSPFLAVLSDRAGMMVSPTAVEEKGEDFKNSPVGTGPFKFVERVKQDKIVVEKNADYWGGEPNFEKIIYRPYSDENVRVTNLVSGDVDIINKVPPKDVEKLEKDPNITLSEKGALGFQGLYLNNKSEPFSNQKLRNALDLVIDREAIVKVALRDTAVTSGGPIAPGTWAFDESIKPKDRDIEQAKKLMAEAGHPDGFSFTLKITAKPVEEQLAQMIQSMAGEAGIKVEVEKVEFGTMLDQMDNFEFDAVRLGWSGRTDPDGNIHALYHSTGYINYGYSNPEMDKLLEDARTETDQEKRKELYTKAQQLGQEESPFIFIYHEKDYKGFKNYLQGYPHIPDTMMRFHEVSFK
ncbi:ABC transporter substrate-binding protein [Bacillus marinisedimentorum]|uniref:ABC transporter substrate-binding protein n=1 Tax=Bacillus marinisedimentorum TaxID=1821260 RepID=UPI0007E191CA|nr:ABC transporter substrate-binding protein [Bacillus marinisedimentorum]